MVFIYLIPKLLFFWGAGGIWGKGPWSARASVGHDRQPASGEKDVKRDEVEVFGNGGLVGGPSKAMMAGSALLLYLDNANTSTVAAKAAVLPRPAMMRWGVSACCRVPTAALQLASANLHNGTVKGKTAFILWLTSWAASQMEIRYSSVRTQHDKRRTPSTGVNTVKCVEDGIENCWPNWEVVWPIHGVILS